MDTYDDSVQAFWDKHPSEQGWGILTAVSNGDTLTVIIQQRSTIMSSYAIRVGPQDTVLRKVEAAVLQAIQQLEVAFPIQPPG